MYEMDYKINLIRFDFRRLPKPYDTDCHNYGESNRFECLNDCYFIGYFERLNCTPTVDHLLTINYGGPVVKWSGGQVVNLRDPRENG